MNFSQETNQMLNDHARFMYGYGSSSPSRRDSSKENDSYGDHTNQGSAGTKPCLDTTDVSYSPTSSKPDYEDEGSDEECLMPPDRMARKQRSFHRRGGESHSNLLKAAVMASMEDFEDYDDDEDDDDDENFFQRAGHNSCCSNLSLQSLQEALEKEAISPRKRVRRRDDDDDNDAVPVGIAVDVQQPSIPARPGPPLRRVSRRTSYDSRCSLGADSDESLEE